MNDDKQPAGHDQAIGLIRRTRDRLWVLGSVVCEGEALRAAAGLVEGPSVIADALDGLADQLHQALRLLGAEDRPQPGEVCAAEGAQP